MRVIRKEKRSKKERGPCPDGKVENAMKPRFPLSHRARHHRRRDHETENPNRKGGRPIDRHHRPKPATDPAVSNCRHPAVLVDAGHPSDGLRLISLCSELLAFSTFPSGQGPLSFLLLFSLRITLISSGFSADSG